VKWVADACQGFQVSSRTMVAAPRWGTAPAMPNRPSADPVALQLRREALAFALPDLRMSVWLMWLAILPVVALGWWRGQVAAVGITLLLCLANSVFRLRIARSAASLAQMNTAAVQRLEHQIERTALAAGLMWGLTGLLIYPHLGPTGTAMHVMIVAGSSALATFYLAPIGRSLAWLLVPMLLPLVAVNLVVPAVRSVPMAVLMLVYLVVMLAAGQRLRQTAQLAIRRGLEAAQANERLVLARDQAEQAMHATNRFLATMSHELRTPMNGVLGTLALLERSTLTPPQRRLLGLARLSGEGLMVVLNDVLDMSKIQADRLELRPSAASPLALAEAAVALFEPSAQQRGLALRLQVAAGPLPPAVWIDAQRLRQVLLNLLGNALKFTEHGEVLLQLQAEPAGDGQVRLRLAVQDTGIGIAQADQARLFEPFHQVDQGLQRQHGGTGLGLAISQRLVVAMGGRITLHSTPGEGSRFEFALTVPLAAPATLPARPAAAPPVDAGPGNPAAAPSHTAAAPLAGLQGRVLLAEENGVARALGEALLTTFGLQVQAVADGAQALAALRGPDPPDLLLLDARLPGLDPAALCQAWRSRHGLPADAPVPAVALSDDGDGPLAAAAEARDLAALGFAGRLARPYEPEQLHAVAARWLPLADQITTSAPGG